MTPIELLLDLFFRFWDIFRYITSNLATDLVSVFENYFNGIANWFIDFLYDFVPILSRPSWLYVDLDLPFELSLFTILSSQIIWVIVALGVFGLLLRLVLEIVKIILDIIL